MAGGHYQRLRRRRFFVACEGDSEYGYAALLQRLADESGLAVHLDIRKYRGGDPLAVVEKAVKELSSRANRRGEYDGQAIFLDADRRNDSIRRTMQADRLIRQNEFRAVWSQPAFESLLLKHLRGCERLQPATANLALRELRDRWPEYRKGMNVGELRSRIDLAAVERSAAVLPELRRFLVAIGLSGRDAVNS